MGREGTWGDFKIPVKARRCCFILPFRERRLTEQRFGNPNEINGLAVVRAHYGASYGLLKAS
jgi:hypothetical protein